MASYTFPGGVKLPERENAKKNRLKPLPAPAVLTVPLKTCGSSFCVLSSPLVKAGDQVMLGQKIAEDESGSYPLHSPVSGRVKEIREDDGKSRAIVLENDFEERPDPSVAPFTHSLMHAASEQLLEVIRNAGIPLFEEDGSALYDRLRLLLGNARTLILSSVRSEPWITGGYRLLLENPGAVIGGLKILLKLLSLRSGILAVEDRCKELLEAVEEIAFDPALLRTVYVKSKYPGWAARPLIYAVTGKPLPKGKRPEECGILLIGPETCAAVYNAFVNGMPVVRRIVTLDSDGDFKAGNYFAPLGMSLRSLLHLRKTEKDADFSELMKRNTAVLGGLMKGNIVSPDECVIGKSLFSVYLLQGDASEDAMEGSCIRCGCCMTVCPVGLAPIMLYRFIRENKTEDAKRCKASDCIGCGCCSFVCPAGVKLTETISRFTERAGASAWDPASAEDAMKASEKTAKESTSSENTKEGEDAG